MKTIKIASLGTDNKVVYDVAGNRYFLPERFRGAAAIGKMALITTKTFNSHTVVDDKGESTIEACEPWNRDDVTMMGDLKTVALAKHESTINAGLEEALVAAEIVNLKKEFSLEGISLEEAAPLG